MHCVIIIYYIYGVESLFGLVNFKGLGISEPFLFVIKK